MDLKQRIDRHEFLKKMGLSGAALLAVYCTGGLLSSCEYNIPQPNANPNNTLSNKNVNNPNNTPVDTSKTAPKDTTSSPSTCSPSGGSVAFTINLLSNLTTVGSYLRQNNIVVARVAADSFVAVTQVCPHKNHPYIYYTGSEFYCPDHGATFNISGNPTNGVTANHLKVYSTYLCTNTNTLTVYS